MLRFGAVFAAILLSPWLLNVGTGGCTATVSDDDETADDSESGDDGGSSDDTGGDDTADDDGGSPDDTADDDSEAPTILGTSPTADATGVTVDSAIEVTFSEAIEITTVTGSSFTVTDGSSEVSGTFTWSEDHTQVTFLPDAPLFEDTTYTVTLLGDITDLAGNPLSPTSLMFSTGDFTAPTIVSCSPASGATGVSGMASITCTFSEPIDSSTVTAGTVTLSLADDGTPVSGTPSLSDDGLVVTFAPLSDLAQNTEHCLDITAGVTDLAGVALSASTRNCFTTMCASSDDFSNSNSLACFSFFEQTSSFQSVAPPGQFLDSLTISNGVLTLDHNAVASGAPSEGFTGFPNFVKELERGDFELEVFISSTSLDQVKERIDLLLFESSFNDTFVIVYHFSGGAKNIRRTSRLNGVNSSSAPTNVNASQLYLRIGMTTDPMTGNNTYSASYSTDGTSYTSLGSAVTRTPDVTDALSSLASDTLYIGLVTRTENSANNFAPVVDYFRFNSGGAVGQE